MAEANGYTGKQIVAALAKGIEIQGRMQYAGDQYVPEDLPFHPPGVSGCVGAAVTAGHLLKLNTEQLRHAIALSQLSLEYQPLVDLRTSRIFAVEAFRRRRSACAIVW